MNARTNSTAVMARRVEPATSLDFFPTPPWATRALCHHVLPLLKIPPQLMFRTAKDPACGEGHMALALAESFDQVEAADIFRYGFGDVADFLHPDTVEAPVDWIISNPPFNLASDFVLRALDVAEYGVAMLVRTAFLEGEGRFQKLFKRRPPSIIAQFSERVPMHRGRWVMNGKSATAYCWLVWHKHPPHDFMATGPRFVWIPKSRIKLSRPDDWLHFSGVYDLPKTHAAMKILEQLKKPKAYREPVLTIAQVRAEMEREARTPATIGDIARELGALL